MNRRDLLRLLSHATLLALGAFGAAGCGGSGKKSSTSPNEGNVSMASASELSGRLDTVRHLLDAAEQTRQTVLDPLQSAQLATQIAIGNAVLVLAERVSELDGIHQEMSNSAGRLSDINNHTRDIADALDTIKLKT